MPRAVLLLCLAALILGWAAGLAFAQGANGSIGGTITDPAGARIPGATVTAINTETNVRRTGVATETGDYQILQLPPGSYDMSVAANGFKTAERKGIQVQVADRLTLNFELPVGSLTETVVVTSEVPLLRTEDVQVGQIIDSLMIQNLPQINRNALDLMRISGNVSGSGKANVGGGPDATNPDDTMDTRVNGGRTSGVEYLVDGASIMSGKAHSVPGTAIPSLETVAEFKIISNGISAEYGRASGGVVELATKSGTNELHGQAFEYFWNQSLNANSWANNSAGLPRAAFHRNDYGFLVGGPVYLPKIYDGRNKTFFVFNFEQLKLRTAGTGRTGMAPTDAERNGDFTGMLYNGASAMMWDPLGEIGTDADGNLIKLTPLGGDGKHIPADRMDPGAKMVMSLMQGQNRAPQPGYSDRSAFVGTTSQVENTSSWDLRLDHNLSDKQHAYVRLKRETWNNLSTGWYNAMWPNDGNVGHGSASANLSWLYTINPTTILTLRGSLMHNPNGRTQDYTISMADWQFDPLLKSMQRDLPTVNWHTWNANQMGWGDMLGGQNVIPSADNYTNGMVAASLSKVYNRHTLKVGFESRRYYDNHYEDFPAGMEYMGAAVAQQNYGDPTWWNGDTGFANSWGGFLLGVPDSATKTNMYTMANANNYYGAYIQDDFRLSSKLTLNLGLRWDMETPMSERHNKLFGWDPGAPSAWTVNSGWNWNEQLANAGLTSQEIASLPVPGWVKAGKFPNGSAFFADTPEHRGRLMQAYHPWHFAPRLGVAYQVRPKTVIRASFGKMYMTRTGNYWDTWLTGADSVSSSVWDRNPLTGNIDHNHMNLWYPDEYVRYVPTNAELNRTLGSHVGSTGNSQITSTLAETPSEYNWAFSVQHQLPASMLLEVGYNGNHSGTLMANVNTSVFPASLIQPQYQRLLSATVDNPVRGQVQATGLTTNDQVPLGYLMLDNPVFGGFTYDGANIGRSNYNALNVKLEKRLSHGIAFLVNYSYSKSLDNVGGIDSRGYKPYQSFQTIGDIYGLSPFDETHRFTFYHDIQFPIGRGQKLLGAPSSTGARVLEKIVGGWEYAGTAVIRSGRPISFTPAQANQQQGAGVPSLWGSIIGDPRTIGSADFSNNNQVLRSDFDAPTGVCRFDPSRFVSTQSGADGFVVGNLAPIYGFIRHPGATSYDGSLMKKFALFREGTYLQVRMEAQNLFNIRGFGPYVTQYDDPNFGFITADSLRRANQIERRMQVSARIVF